MKLQWEVRDEADVAWFFQHGLAAFGRSTFGAQLERAALAGVDSCGHRIESERELANRASVYRERRTIAGLPLFEYGHDEVDAAALPDDDAGPDRAVTARQTLPQGREEPGYTPDDSTLQRFARVSRALSCAPASAYDVLCRYYLFGGNWEEVRRDEHKLPEQLRRDFAELRKYGRLLELFPLTQSGEQLIEVAAKRSDRQRKLRESERPVFVVAHEAIDQLRWPDIARGKLLLAAKSEATKLIAAARVQFALARSELDRRST